MKAAGLALALLTALLGRSTAAEPATWRFVTEHFPPYTLEQADGRAAGPMADVLRKVCAELLVECRVEVLPWRRALAAAERGEVDGVFTIVDLPERRAAFHVSDPVIEARYVFYARDGDPFVFASPRDLRQRHVGVYGPSASSNVLAGLIALQPPGEEPAQMQVEVDNPTVLRKLQAGRYGPNGLAMLSEKVAETIIARDRLDGLHAAGVASRFTYSFGLSRLRVTAAQAARFNAALGALCRSGGLQALLEPYRMKAPPCRR